MKRQILFLIISSILTGCATYQVPAPEPIPPVLMGVTHAPRPNIAVGDFLYRGEDQIQGYGAYGYVLLTSKLSDQNKDRYQKVSEAFLDTLPVVSSYSDFSKSQLMVTSWPLVSHLNPQDYNPSSILSNYDYAASNVILSMIDRENSYGPVLIAFTVPYNEWDKTRSYLMLDMSMFSDAEIQNAFQIWKDEITTNSDLWRNGLNFNIAKAIFRSLINKYGETILKVYKV